MVTAGNLGGHTRQEVTHGRFVHRDSRMCHSFIACPKPCHPGARRGVGKGPQGCTRAQPGSIGTTAVKMMICDQEISTALAQNWGRVEETARNAGKDENTCWP